MEGMEGEGTDGQHQNEEGKTMECMEWNGTERDSLTDGRHPWGAKMLKSE